MTDANTPRREGDNGNHDLMRYAPYLGAAAFALLFVLFAIYRPSLVSMSSPSSDSDAQTLPTKLDKEDAATAAEVALGRTLLESKKKQMDEADAALTKLNAEIDRWDAEVTALLTNEDGHYLASDAELVKAFDMLHSKNRPSRQSATDMLAKLDPVRAFIDDALADPRRMLAPPKEIAMLVSSVLEELTNAIALYRNDRETIVASVNAAREAGDLSDRTLESAVAVLHQRYATDRMRLLAEKRERFERENREQLAEVEYRKAREIGDAEAAKKEAELEAQRLRIQTEAELTAARAKADRRTARASDPAVQAKYAPFLRKGKTALGVRGMRQYYWRQRNGPPGPVSLTRLRQAGVLDDVKGFVAVATIPGNDRGSWPAPATEQDWSRYKDLLREFNELAPTWLKLGVLDP